MTSNRDNPLGHQTPYPKRYDPDLLFAIPRQPARVSLKLDELPAFAGADVWNAYEVSWLLPNGCPQVATARIVLDAHTRCLVESKSLKLYLNSLNNSKFNCSRSVQDVIENDLRRVVQGELTVSINESASNCAQAGSQGQCLDDLAPEADTYQVDSALLQPGQSNQVEEIWHTNLFRSLCPITGQPDWATVTVAYQGQAIEPSSLLRYLISFREHGGYHEQCVEQIFADLHRRFSLQSLCVDARFLRRGGLDINPVRSQGRPIADYTPAWRQ